MKFSAVILLFFLIMMLWTGCTGGPNRLEKTPGTEGRIAGFWKGLWHGFITPLTFLVSLFTDQVRFYEVHNNGNWYNFGYVLGAGLFLSGGILGRKKNRRRR